MKLIYKKEKQSGTHANVDWFCPSKCRTSSGLFVDGGAVLHDGLYELRCGFCGVVWHVLYEGGKGTVVPEGMLFVEGVGFPELGENNEER